MSQRAWDSCIFHELCRVLRDIISHLQHHFLSSLYPTSYRRMNSSIIHSVIIYLWWSIHSCCFPVQICPHRKAKYTHPPHKCCFDVQNEMRKRSMSEESSVYTTYSRSKWHTQQQFPLLCAGINYIWLLEFTLESAGSYCILAESHCWWRSSELVLASHNVASEWEAKLQSARLKLIIFVLGFLCGVLGHLRT